MIIILIIISVILITFNMRGLKNNNKESFNNILNEKEKSINKNDIEMIKLRKDLSETIVEIQRDMLNLKEEIEYLKFQNYELKSKGLNNKVDINEKDFAIIKDKNFEEIKKENDNKEENNKTSKINEVKKLIDLKKSDEEICSMLHIGRGELLLIKGLYK